MKCPQCDGNNFKWAARCDHCGQALANPISPDVQAEGPRILTPTGAKISLTPATAAQIDLLRICWPFGLREWPGTQRKYGLICRRQDREMMAVTFAQADVPVAAAPFVSFQNRVLIALALRGYLKRGHRGFIMPCAYTRPEGADRAETGIAYLVGPHPGFRSVSRELPDERWDAAIGAGATAMVAEFAREVGRVVDQAPQGTSGNGASIGRPVFLTMELRPVSTLGVLDSRLSVLGPDVLVTMPDPGATIDSAWEFVLRAGFTSLSHAPIAPVELGPEESMHPL